MTYEWYKNIEHVFVNLELWDFLKFNMLENQHFHHYVVWSEFWQILST
jgi:hypothetical protein